MRKNKLLFVSMFIGFFILSVLPAGAYYEAPVTVTNNPNITGYQAKVIVLYQTGMSVDFSNIRFYNNTTSIPYWIESYTTGVSAQVYIPINPTTNITCRWGDTVETSSESDIAAVMDFGDDFASSTLNTTKWSLIAGTATITDGVLTLNSGANIKSVATYGTNYTLMTSVMLSSDGNPLVGFDDLNDSYVRICYGYPNAGAYALSTSTGPHSVINSINGQSLASTTTVNITRIQQSNATADYNGLNSVSSTLYVPTGNLNVRLASGTNAVTCQWICVRKYTEVEPTLSIGTAVLSASASFAANTTEGKTPLTIQFTDSSTGNVTAWLWDFGDGTNSTVQNPVHTYTLSGSSDNTYTVTLTVNNNTINSDTLTKVNYINVLTDTDSAFSVTQTTAIINDAILFTDCSTSNPVSWLWTFGDGTTSTTQNVTHAYKSNGDYTVSLRVTTANGTVYTRIKTNYITIYSAPDVSFTAVPITGYEPLTIAFTDTSTLGGVSTWLWNFGDGTTSTVQNPTHTYNSAGTYTVTLTLANYAGTTTRTKTNYITVSHITAAFSANVTSGTAYLPVKFTDTSQGTPTSWSWDFGGGSAASTEQSPEVNFTVPGLYTVTLTVANAYGVDSEIKQGYIRIADNGTSIPMVLTNVSHTWQYVPLNTSVDFTFASNQPVALSHYQLSDGAIVNATNQSMAYTFTEPGYYWMDVWAENGNGVSEKIQYRVRVGRATATEHIEKLNDSAYYKLENSTLNMSTDGILVALTVPFTDSIGRSFYLVLFVLPFLFLWFQQGKLTIPTTLALITGALFISYIPDQYTAFIGIAIVLSFAANFYKISRGN